MKEKRNLQKFFLHKKKRDRLSELVIYRLEPRKSSFFFLYTDRAYKQRNVSILDPVSYIYMVQSVKENCDAVRDNAGRNENFKRDEVKTEASTDKRGKRPFDSLSNAARVSCHVPKGRCPAYTRFCLIPSPPLPSVPLAPSHTLPNSSLTSGTHIFHTSIKDLSMNRILSRICAFFLILPCAHSVLFAYEFYVNTQREFFRAYYIQSSTNDIGQ